MCPVFTTNYNIKKAFASNSANFIVHKTVHISERTSPEYSLTQNSCGVKGSNFVALLLT